MNIYYGSITWAEYQITKGTEVTDRIGLTENLTLEVKKTFRNYSTFSKNISTFLFKLWITELKS